MRRALLLACAATGIAAAAPVAADAGTLHVRWQAVRTGAMPIEGHTAYQRLTRGRRVVHRGRFRARHRALAAGFYGLSAWHRIGCGPGCRDAPSQRCSRRVRVPRSGVARWTVETNLVTGRCAIRRGHLSDYVGLDEGEAVALARRRGRVLRVVERDGEPLAVTEDFSETRINVAVRGGRVTRFDGLY